MPRTARIVIPSYPHHIIQRGHNRHSVFAGKDDYLYYLDNLAEWKQRLECRVYAFCLMTNHVHLVIAPGEDPESLGRLMKRLAGRQTRFVNRMEGRSGTLWEGRFKSSPIETNAYLLACCRYVEMNPVLAGMCAEPSEYPWSSCSSKTLSKRWAWIRRRDRTPAESAGGIKRAGATEKRRKINLSPFCYKGCAKAYQVKQVLKAIERLEIEHGRER